jgi:hypothetical protein
MSRQKASDHGGKKFIFFLCLFSPVEKIGHGQFLLTALMSAKIGWPMALLAEAIVTS